jgi:nitrite reductase (NADH) small subunit
VRFGDREIAIFNLGDRFLAVDNRCPHKGGPLSDGIVSGATVVCPLHAWKVNLETGSVLNTPESPQSVLNEIGAKPNRVAPAPNTWHDILRGLDDVVGPKRLRGMRIAVQEYRVPARDCLRGYMNAGRARSEFPFTNGPCPWTWFRCGMPRKWSPAARWM